MVLNKGLTWSTTTETFGDDSPYLQAQSWKSEKILRIARLSNLDAVLFPCRRRESTRRDSRRRECHWNRWRPWATEGRLGGGCGGMEKEGLRSIAPSQPHTNHNTSHNQARDTWCVRISFVLYYSGRQSGGRMLKLRWNRVNSYCTSFPSCLNSMLGHAPSMFKFNRPGIIHSPLGGASVIFDSGRMAVTGADDKCDGWIWIARMVCDVQKWSSVMHITLWNMLCVIEEKWQRKCTSARFLWSNYLTVLPCDNFEEKKRRHHWRQRILSWKSIYSLASIIKFDMILCCEYICAAHRHRQWTRDRKLQQWNDF